MTAPPPEIDLWDGARARLSTRRASGACTTRCAARPRTRWRSGGQEVLDPAQRPRRLPPVGGPVRPRDRRVTPTGSSASAGSRGPTGSRRRCPRTWPRRGSAGTSSWSDLAVLESHRRHGGGRRLHDVLMDGETRPRPAGHRRRRHGGRAAVHRRAGWQRLGLLSEGVQVMGLLPAAGPRRLRSLDAQAAHRVGRGSRIRTGGLPLPKRTRYQAAPYPVAVVRAPSGTHEGCRISDRATAGIRLTPRSTRTDGGRSRGCSSMAEPQPSKLAMPVRSRSPAPP